ncbi:MAG TPA: glycosyltransferase family 39 protein, partial [Acidimicrobiales bacterium]|nr:glycosyltransferase family 39 protein [Acidimicrobiales bacterium]
LLGRRVGGRTTAIWSVVLTAISPYMVRYSTEARMYALVMVLVLAGAVLLLDALDRPTTPRLVGIAAVAAALVYTQYWAFYLLAALVVVLGLRWWREADQRPTVTRIIVALAAGCATFAAWAPAFLDQLAHTGTPWSIPARPTQVVSDVFADLGGGGLVTFAEGQLYGMLAFALVALGVLTVRADRDEEATLTAAGDLVARELAAVAFGTLAIGAVVGFLTGAAFNSRYGSTVVPLLLVLAALGLSRLPRGWPVAGAALGLLVLGPVASARVVRLDRTENGDLAALIAERAAPGDVVVACPDQLGVSLERALADTDAGLEVLPYPMLDSDPRFVDWRDYAERNDAVDPAAVARDASSRGTGALWLVHNFDYRTFEGDCEQVVATLTELRGQPEVVRQAPDERAFEPGDLLRFG